MLRTSFSGKHQEMKSRLGSVDFIRGLAIAAMIQIHFWGAFIEKGSYVYDFVAKWIVLPLGGYAAPLFILISGQSARLLMRSMSVERPSPPTQLRNVFIKRGLLLFAFSTLINLFTGEFLHIGGIRWLNWSIFQLIGFAYLFMPFFVRWAFLAKALFSTLILISPMGELGPRFIPSAFLSGFMPFFPWASLFFFGYLIGDLFIADRCLPSTRRYSIGFLSGLLMLIIRKPLFDYFQIPFNNWDKHLGMNLASFTVYMGYFLCLISLCAYLLDDRGFRTPLVGAISGLGQRSLTVYYLQLFSIIGLGMLIRRLFMKSAVLHPIWFLPALMLIFLTLHVAINKIWRAKDYKFSLEWLLRELSAREWRFAPKA
jgi:uncharacterized membrane protein